MIIIFLEGSTGISGDIKCYSEVGSLRQQECRARQGYRTCFVQYKMGAYTYLKVSKLQIQITILVEFSNFFCNLTQSLNNLFYFILVKKVFILKLKHFAKHSMSIVFENKIHKFLYFGTFYSYKSDCLFTHSSFNKH